jgi:hypothetical protein
MVDRRISVYVYAHDPITRSGLTAQLRGRPEFELVEATDPPPAVAVLAIETADESALQLMRGLRAHGCDHLVLVVNELSDDDLMATVEAGVGSIVWRSRASASWLAQTVINAARGEAALPPEILARLLKQVTRLRRHVLVPRGLSQARGRRARHRGDRAPAVLLQANGHQRAARRVGAVSTAQPHPRRGLRHQGRPDLTNRRIPCGLGEECPGPSADCA